MPSLPAVEFDVRAIPFSTRGAWLNISPVIGLHEYADDLHLVAHRNGHRNGLTPVLRLLHPDEPIYTFWDYQAGAWQRNNGIRIDHQVMSPQAVDRLTSIRVDRNVRGWDKPSDHVPVIAELDV